MKIKILFLIILLCLSSFISAEEEGIEFKGGQLFTPEMVEDIKELVEGVPIQDQEIREIRDAANVWKRDSANSQIELRDAKALDMQSQQIDNVLDPTAAQDAATKNYVDTNADMLYSDARLKVGYFTHDSAAASGDQEVTGVGFEPKTVIFFMGEVNQDEASWGVDDGNSALSISSIGTNFDYNASSIRDWESADNDCEGYISAFGNDGFTITWTKTGLPTGVIYIIYWAAR